MSLHQSILNASLVAVVSSGLGWYVGQKALRNKISTAFSTFSELPKEQQTAEVQETTVRLASGFKKRLSDYDVDAWSWE